jgi:hypothetical protein
VGSVKAVTEPYIITPAGARPTGVREEGSLVGALVDGAAGILRAAHAQASASFKKGGDGVYGDGNTLDEIVAELREELYLMSHLHHPHILQFLGGERAGAGAARRGAEAAGATRARCGRDAARAFGGAWRGWLAGWLAGSQADGRAVGSTAPAAAWQRGRARGNWLSQPMDEQELEGSQPMDEQEAPATHPLLAGSAHALGCTHWRAGWLAARWLAAGCPRRLAALVGWLRRCPPRAAHPRRRPPPSLRAAPPSLRSPALSFRSPPSPFGHPRSPRPRSARGSSPLPPRAQP